MRGLTRLMRLRQRWRIAYWSRMLRWRCANAGAGLQVFGPCVIEGGGQIALGGHLVIRSRAHNQVELHVAPPACLRIGEYTVINQGVRISCSQQVEIGSSCLIGDECVILDNNFHGKADEAPKRGPVRIEDHVWLATRVIVLCGVTIGTGSVIGAGSVVTRSIPPHSFAAGAPARVISSLAQ